jgi:hypothetical protein
MTKQEHLLDDLSDEKLPLIRRRSLLPIWMKIFVWFFMILGIAAIPLLILGLSGFKFYIGLYGLETNTPGSFIGILLEVVFVFKAVVSFFLWFEKKQAIVLALIDAAVGILICFGVMFNFQGFALGEHSINFRPETLVLMLYLIKLIRIRSKWGLAGERRVSGWER